MVDLSTDHGAERPHLRLNIKGWTWLACFGFGAAAWVGVIIFALNLM